MTGNSECKVDEVISRYDLDTADPRYESLDEGLLTRWTGTDGRDAMGYRTLTEWFNKRLLRRVYDRHGREMLGDRIDHDYKTLTSDDDLVREDAIADLEADGIDGEAVRNDMVSWGTMRTHLQECLGGTKAQPTSSSDWERETVAMAQSFATDKVESALSSLSTKGRLAGVEESTVAVQIQLQCDHCPTRVPFDVALERGYVCEQHAEVEAHA
jgi:hypothetical protein